MIRLGTRGSALALAQTSSVADSLRKLGTEVELVTISTEGDTSKASLASLGGTGVFASALREALVDDRVDAVVHSLKDLPTAAYPGLTIGATPRREDARDVLCARDGLTLEKLPEGSSVGTGSPRRRAQLLARRPDLKVVDVRGNVDTRLGRLTIPEPVEGRLDAVVLAAAGLSRLGRLEAATDYFALASWPTAPGQGAVAVEVRAGEEKPVAALDHKATRVNVEAEREVLALLEAGCAAPVGVNAFVEDGLLFLSARVYSLDGTSQLTSSHALYLSDSKHPGSELAQRVAHELLDNGAADLAPLGSKS